MSGIETEGFEAFTVSVYRHICTIAFARPEIGNPIDSVMLRDFSEVMRRLDRDQTITLLVLRGDGEVFCGGGDLKATGAEDGFLDPAPLFDIWEALSDGPFVTVAVVEGAATAGGVGFAAACDIVLAAPSSRFGLSELLFGLYPACVLPFLVRRIGWRAANQMALTTRSVQAEEAATLGLVDAVGADLDALLRAWTGRLRYLKKPAIARYKAYMAGVTGRPPEDREAALTDNRSLFQDADIRADLRRFSETGRFPWEG